MIGAISCGRRKVCLIERTPSAATTRGCWRVVTPGARLSGRSGLRARRRRLRALEVVAGLGDEDVVERRLDEVERLDREPRLVERAHDRRHPRRAPASSSTSARRPWRAAALPKRRQDLAAPARQRPVGEHDLEVRAADLGLERRRRALGDDPAVVDDPDPVGELVGLLEVLGGQEDGRPLVGSASRPPPRSPCGSPGRGRSSARRGTAPAARGPAPRRGRAGAASRRSRSRPGGRRRSRRPTRSSSALGAAAALGARQPVQRRLEPDQLAAGHQRVERGLLERDADRAAHAPRHRATTSCPATVRAAAGRAQQRRQHPHGRRLAGAVGAEERVDLAAPRPRGRRRRRRDADRGSVAAVRGSRSPAFARIVWTAAFRAP